MLTYSRYFLGCPRPCLIEAREAKAAEGDGVASSIGGISTEGALVWNVFVEAISAGGAFAWSTYIGARLSIIDFWSSIK